MEEAELTRLLKAAECVLYPGVKRNPGRLCLKLARMLQVEELRDVKLTVSSLCCKPKDSPMPEH